MKTPPALNLEIPFNECQIRFQFMKFKSNLREKTQDESLLDSFKESKSRKKYDQKYDGLLLIKFWKKCGFGASKQ